MDETDLAEWFEWFADWARGTSPLYERLARRVIDDEPIRDLVARVPEGQPPPHLLFAAVHFLLLDGADHRLREHYPTCVDDPVEGDPYPAFREFCLRHEAAIREFAASHNTQTNSVRRSAALLPAFAHVSRLVGSRPLALVEIGTSAGLNLSADRYRYEYVDHGAYGPEDSPVTIESEIRGDLVPPIPSEMPPIASRTGIDLNPLDLADPTDLHTLRAFIWPEHAERHRLIQRAATVVRDEDRTLVAGDATERLPGVLSSIPVDVPVCLFDTQVRYQMDDDQLSRLESVVRDAGRDRELYWLSGDETAPDREHGIYLSLTSYAGDDPVTERLAVYEQHGKWVEWLDRASAR